MFWPVDEDYFLRPYSEQCEQEFISELKESTSEYLSINELKNCASFVTAQRIAKDFEETYHLIKSLDSNHVPLLPEQLLNPTYLRLSKPKINIPVEYRSGKSFQIEVDLDRDQDIVYYDIQPKFSRTLNEKGNEVTYFGAHLLGLVAFHEGIQLENGIDLPADNYPFVMPFKDLKVSSEHRASVFN
jgi:hypothetical protein